MNKPLTKYEIVKQSASLPFELYPYQIKVIEDLAGVQKSGYYLDMGTGKTITSLCSFIYQYAVDLSDHLIIICPPILIDGWVSTVNSIKELEGEVIVYRGTKAQRKRINIGSKTVTIMSLGIFKNDLDRIEEVFKDKRSTIILDEATFY